VFPRILGDSFEITEFWRWYDLFLSSFSQINPELEKRFPMQHDLRPASAVIVRFLETLLANHP
jgi:hypothetical protein